MMPTSILPWYICKFAIQKVKIRLLAGCADKFNARETANEYVLALE